MSASGANAEANAKADADVDGQNKAVGHVLLALGGLGVVLGTVGLAFGLHLEFLDPAAMAVSGLVMAAVGVWQRSSSRKRRAG